MPEQPLEDGSATDPLVGSVFDGRYRILSIIGQGGMGNVYAADHLVLKRHVAIKVLRREFLFSKEASLRFIQEARAVSAIGHPNIVAIFEFGTVATGELYFAMERPEGFTANVLMARERPFRIALAIEIGRQVARGIHAAHEQGIIHRDLKAHNVIVAEDADGRVSAKILDFGVALASGADGNATRLTQQGIVIGTPHCMAPEQAAGRTIDRRVDVYALGVMLYEMVTGRLPFTAPTAAALMRKQMYEAAEPPRSLRADLPPALNAVIMRALEKDRDRRFATAGEMAQALAALDDVAPDGVAPDEVALVASTAAVADATTPATTPAAPDTTAEVARIEDRVLRPPAADAPTRRGRTAALVALAVLLALTLVTVGERERSGRERVAVMASPANEAAPEGLSTTANSPAPGSEMTSASASSSVPFTLPKKLWARLSRKADLDGGLAARRYREGREALLGGHFRAAEAAFLDVLGAAPHSAPAHRGLGFARAELGNTTGARESLRRYLQMRPEADDAETVRLRLETLK